MSSLAYVCKPYPIVAATNLSGSVNPMNVANDRMGRAATLNASGGSFYVDLGSPLPVDTAAVLATDAPSNGTWRLTAYSSVANVNTGSPAAIYDSGDMTLWASADAARRVHRNGIKQFASVTARYWRVDWTNGPFHLGRLVLGAAFTAADSIDVGWILRVVDLGEDKYTTSGLEDSLVRGKVAEYNWTWSWMTEAEARGALLDFLAYAGTTKPVLLVLKPDVADLHNVIGYGTIKTAPDLTSLVSGAADEKNAYSAEFTLRSRLVLSL